jgi:hypothetical protein
LLFTEKINRDLPGYTKHRKERKKSMERKKRNQSQRLKRKH